MQSRKKLSGRWVAHLVMVAAWLMGLLVTAPVAAHGGGTPQLVNEPAGNYLVSVWTAPNPLRVGQVHLTIALSELTTEGLPGEPLLGAAVRVMMEPQDIPGAQPIGGLATHEQSVNRLFYEIDLEVPAEGLWQVTLLLDGPAGRGQVSFDVQVLPPGSGLGLVWPIAAGVAILLAIVYIYRQGTRTQQPQPAAQDKQS